MKVISTILSIGAIGLAKMCRPSGGVCGKRWIAMQILVGVLAISISACASVPDRSPIPADMKGSAQIVGIDRARYFADIPPPGWAERVTQPREILKANSPELFGRKHTYIAI